MGYLEALLSSKRPAPYSVSKPLKHATPNQTSNDWNGKKVHNADSSWANWAYQNGKRALNAALDIAPLAAVVAPNPLTVGATALACGRNLYNAGKEGNKLGLAYAAVGLATSAKSLGAQAGLPYQQGPSDCSNTANNDVFIPCSGEPLAYGKTAAIANGTQTYYETPVCHSGGGTSILTTANTTNLTPAVCYPGGSNFDGFCASITGNTGCDTARQPTQATPSTAPKRTIDFTSECNEGTQPWINIECDNPAAFGVHYAPDPDVILCDTTNSSQVSYACLGPAASHPNCPPLPDGRLLAVADGANPQVGACIPGVIDHAFDFACLPVKQACQATPSATPTPSPAPSPSASVSASSSAGSIATSSQVFIEATVLPTQESQPARPSNDGVNGGAVAGGVIVGVAALGTAGGAIGGVAYLERKRRKTVTFADQPTSLSQVQAASV